MTAQPKLVHTTDNGHAAFYHYISTKHLDDAVVDWTEKIFDRAVLPCKDWMDDCVFEALSDDTRRLYEAVVDGYLSLNELKARASKILSRCAREFATYLESERAYLEREREAEDGG